MIKILEGEFLKSLKDIKLEDATREVNTGYIQIYTTEDDKIIYGYIFVENGEVVGYYYTDNKSVEDMGNPEKVLELFKKENKEIELYKYEKDKLNLLEWLYPEIFNIKKKAKAKEEIIIEEKEEDYINIKLGIPLPIPAFTNVKDFKKYLNMFEYSIVNVYRKSKDDLENGYIVYKKDIPIAAAYECKKGVLFGNKAYKKIKEMLDDKNSIIDIYPYDNKKLNILLEVYPQMEMGYEEKVEEEKKISEFLKKDLENLSRDELLKKLGIKEPDEDWVDGIIKDFLKPSMEDLLDLKTLIENEIKKSLKELDIVEDVLVSININWENGNYIVVGHVNVIRKKLFGLIKKTLKKETVEEIIEKCVRKYLSNYIIKVDISIN
ncbi:hypothetical protein J422_02719 [Methanocaldococcus villosus KIN24-T80]|uniref:Uncharacterized protein n=1 Tax=Methanocaldococcus villosus KIN24-T80 TaxID=1069083 RepID=N6V249_9EURY|nr:DUF2226 domain-containing protein [Methanocaldococcus villosus]ENN96358.1 hypothetical protein J422_02719 [Methanocaldococcus villosus KIN24-T80]